jgi:hypothetical protein
MYRAIPKYSGLCQRRMTSDAQLPGILFVLGNMTFSINLWFAKRSQIIQLLQTSIFPNQLEKLDIDREPRDFGRRAPIHSAGLRAGLLGWRASRGCSRRPDATTSKSAVTPTGKTKPSTKCEYAPILWRPRMSSLERLCALTSRAVLAEQFHRLAVRSSILSRPKRTFRSPYPSQAGCVTVSNAASLTLCRSDPSQCCAVRKATPAPRHRVANVARHLSTQCRPGEVWQDTTVPHRRVRAVRPQRGCTMAATKLGLGCLGESQQRTNFHTAIENLRRVLPWPPVKIGPRDFHSWR